MKKWFLMAAAGLLAAAFMTGCAQAPQAELSENPAASDTGQEAESVKEDRDPASGRPAQEEPSESPQTEGAATQAASEGSGEQADGAGAGDGTSQAAQETGRGTQAQGTAAQTAQTTKASKKTTTTASTRQTTARPATTTSKAAVTTTRTTKPTSAPTSASSAASSGQTAQLESEVVRLVNQERAKQGLPALTALPILEATADVRSRELVQKFSHTRPDGSSCFTAFPAWGDYPDSVSTVAENIAEGYRTPESVMEGWMNSSGHRANILKESHRYIGVGCYESGGRYYWVQVFAG